MIKFSYDTTRYDFSGLISYLLEAQDLARLHELPSARPGLDTAIRRGMLVKTLYNRRSDGLDQLFRRFVAEAVPPVLGPIVSFQERACLRILMHGEDSISAIHCDGDWGQLESVQNVWMPFTRVWGNNSLWLEQTPGKGDFVALELNYGEAVIFPGALLRHGSRANDTGSTRVSADFRVMPRRPVTPPG